MLLRQKRSVFNLFHRTLLQQTSAHSGDIFAVDMCRSDAEYDLLAYLESVLFCNIALRFSTHDLISDDHTSWLKTSRWRYNQYLIIFVIEKHLILSQGIYQEHVCLSNVCIQHTLYRFRELRLGCRHNFALRNVL